MNQTNSTFDIKNVMDKGLYNEREFDKRETAGLISVTSLKKSYEKIV